MYVLYVVCAHIYIPLAEIAGHRTPGVRARWCSLEPARARTAAKLTTQTPRRCVPSSCHAHETGHGGAFLMPMMTIINPVFGMRVAPGELSSPCAARCSAAMLRACWIKRIFRFVTSRHSASRIDLATKQRNLAADLSCRSSLSGACSPSMTCCTSAVSWKQKGTQSALNNEQNEDLRWTRSTIIICTIYEIISGDRCFFPPFSIIKSVMLC